jgi:hypothetical protein
MRVLLIVAVLLAMLVGYFLLANPFSYMLDSPSVVSAEEIELLRDLRSYFKNASLEEKTLAIRPHPTPPEPLKVAISGKDATLTVAGPMYAGDLWYASIWHDVFRKYHGGVFFVVHMHVVWKSGGVQQTFPVSEL